MFLRIAHRGASGTRPEHTRAAFERALSIGVDMIELDVQLTRDHKLVVLHDRELGRTLCGKGAVREYSLAELRAFDAGIWFDPAYAGERVLSLQEVLEMTAGRAALNVEIKSPEPDWPETARALLDLLARHGQIESAIISCFEAGALRCVRERSETARVGVLWQTTDLEPAWREAAGLAAVSVHPHWALVEPDLVAEAHQRGLQLITWTVNDAATARHLADLGVDGIISDYPELFFSDAG